MITLNATPEMTYTEGELFFPATFTISQAILQNSLFFSTWLGELHKKTQSDF